MKSLVYSILSLSTATTNPRKATSAGITWRRRKCFFGREYGREKHSCLWSCNVRNDTVLADTFAMEEIRLQQPG
ncbi:MAG: hypothetical protein IPP51_18070 [Bacteroidetes bacterium]|nr:hypothetical protein [Bacteroidota bacterium]